jgi:hypothetical protein
MQCTKLALGKIFGSCPLFHSTCACSDFVLTIWSGQRGVFHLKGFVQLPVLLYLQHGTEQEWTASPD